MKKILLGIIISTCLIFVENAIAQESAPQEAVYIDVVYLKNGSEFRGKIIEYVPGDYLKFLLVNGGEVKFEDNQIRKVIQESQFQVSKKEKTYDFRERGIYNFTSFSNHNNENRFNQITVGVGLHHVTGFQFNRLIGVGLGTGIDNYEISLSRIVIPVYLEARGYLTSNRVAPYYSMNIGWGLPLTNENQDITKTHGGIFLNPSIGMRFGAAKGANFTMDLGYRYQRATFISDFGFERNKDIYDFRRIVLRFGILL